MDVRQMEIDMFGEALNDDALADELDKLLLGPLPQDMMVTPRIVKELMIKWHGLMAPGHA